MKLCMARPAHLPRNWSDGTYRPEAWCRLPAGHNGGHSWELCEEWTGEPSAFTVECDRPKGHEGPHHAEHEWE